MNKHKNSRIDVQYFLSLLTKYSLIGFISITLILLLSSIFIKISLDHQKRMLRISAVTYEQRLLLRELNETVSFLLRIAKRPLNKQLVDNVRQDIDKSHKLLNKNQQQLDQLFSQRGFIYYYWPFNHFYSANQYHLIKEMRNILNDITPRINSLLTADYIIIETGFNLWEPGFLRTVRQGEHTIALEELNKQVYQSAIEQHGALERLHFYLLFIVIICIWITWLLVLKPLTTRTKFLFNKIQNKEEKLQYQAKHDSLTSLQNRLALKQKIDELNKQNQPAMAVIAIDVDNFKMLNDSYGHSAGDAILQYFSQCIKKTALNSELQFRSGGDEFIIIDKLGTKKTIEARIQNLKNALSQPLNLTTGNTSIQPKISIGIAYQNGDFKNINELYTAADIAMYHIKRKGGNDYAFYSDIESKKVSEIMHLERTLKKAIINKEFTPYYQPVYNIKNGKIAGFEALARWQHPDQGILSPAQWLPIAQRLGMMTSISTMIAKQVLEHQLKLQDDGLRLPRFTINLTEKLLISEELFDLLKRFKNQHQKYEFNIGVEVHESIVLQRNLKIISKKISDLQNQGFSILIDDFGTGYASINHLLHLPFDFLKTDKSLLNDLPNNKKSQVILKAMQNIAEGLNKQLICEGVEDESTLNIIKETGITFVQGYYYAKPMSFHEAKQMIKSDMQNFTQHPSAIV